MLIINITNLSQVTIGAVERKVCNAGHELLSVLDIRFVVKKDLLKGETKTGFGNILVARTC